MLNRRRLWWLWALLAGLIVLGFRLLYRSFAGEEANHIVLLVGLAVGVVGGLVTFGSSGLGSEEARRRLEEQAKRLSEIQAKADQQPERSRYAWELASAKLEQYFDRNLDQVKSIYIVSVSVMSAGFIVIVLGAVLLLLYPSELSAATLVSVSGIITEFIGAMFMLVYRSTMQQAASYVETLERINTVGMAIQILDTMPTGESGHLKDSAKADLVKLLVSGRQAIAQSNESKLS